MIVALESDNATRLAVKVVRGHAADVPIIAGEVVIEFPPAFELAADDALYGCGTSNAFKRYHEAFPRQTVLIGAARPQAGRRAPPGRSRM